MVFCTDLGGSLLSRKRGHRAASKDLDRSPVDLNSLSELDVKNILENAQSEEEAYNTNLRSQAKKKEDLITPLECLVTEVLSYTKVVEMTPQSEMRLGGISPHYITGIISNTELTVCTDGTVRKIMMPGILPLESGDQIRAYIVKGEMEAEQHTLTPAPRYQRDKPVLHLIARDWKEEETAVKIEKMRSDKVVATYTIVDS